MENRQSFGTKQVVWFMVIAYVFSFALRMIWVYQFSGDAASMWNGQLMINTNDGYYFASGAQKWLEGTLQYNPRVPDLFYTATVTLSAFAAKLLPVSLDTVILYMPAVISSLVVIPIILIGRLFKMTLVGFFAALLGAVTWSYYNRTMTGYFDTDMFSAMAPMFILYFLLATIRTEKRVYALLSALAFLIYPFLYDSGRTIVYAMGLLYMGYMVLFHRKEDFTYRSILLITVGLIDLNFWAQFAAIVAIYFALEKRKITAKQAIYASAILIPIFLYTGNVHGLILGKIAYYFEHGHADTGLKFLQVSQTIREAGTIPFNVMANRISGSVLGVIVALIGYILLVIRHREFILALPLIGMGIMSLWAGLRFTVYAVPAAAISAVYLFHLIASSWQERRFYPAILATLTALMLYPNIAHIIEYRVPTVMNHQEVTVLDKLKQLSSPKDYVITWWDYGYPVWYYANKNTLIDGGKHNNDNFIVSEILLTNSQLEAARLSRLAVETYVSSGYQYITQTLFKNNTPEQIDVGDYLDELRYGEVELPAKSREIYLYLPWRMTRILPTIKLFSNLDLKTGKPLSRPFFYATQYFRQEPDRIVLGRGIAWLIDEGKLQIGNQKRDVGQFYTVVYDENGTLNVKKKLITSGGEYHVIYMPNYNHFIVVDDEYLNSTFIQMFVFEHYDPSLFEPVILDPFSKIYRVKI